MSSPPKLGNYQLVRHLAMGGMGEVWLARQQGPAGFSRPVVIKRVLRSHSEDERFVEMFLHEARLAARLVHPNIVQVIELAQQDGEWFMAMEHVHGVTLRTLQKTAREKNLTLDPACVAALASHALVGLHHAHNLRDEAGRPLELVHRDISPDNLMVSYDGVVKVLDFGIARATTAISTTNPGAVRGKLAYLSPELIKGEPADGRSDVFAMGVVLYELLTGQRPFDGQTDAEKLMKVVHHTPPAPSLVRSSVPPVLSELIVRALDKDPSRRFPTAEAMHEALEDALLSLRERVGSPRLAAWVKSIVGEPGLLALTPPPATATFSRPAQVEAATEPIPRSPRRAPWAIPAAVLAAVALVVGAVILLRPTELPPPPPPSEPPPPRLVRVEPTELVVEPPVAPAPTPVVEVDAGAPALAERPKPTSGRVQFLVKPWAEVFLGSRSLGLTPLPAISVPAGRVVFTLRNDKLGVERKVNVTVRAGATTTVRENLLE